MLNSHVNGVEFVRRDAIEIKVTYMSERGIERSLMSLTCLVDEGVWTCTLKTG